MMRCSSPSILTSVPEYLLNSTRSPALTSRAITLPSLSRLPAPTAMTLAWIGFSFAESGMNRPPEVLVSSSRRLTRMRSCSGRIFMAPTCSHRFDRWQPQTTSANKQPVSALTSRTSWYATGVPLTDYEKYIRTEELLALQKPPDALSCHDE